MRAVEIFLGPEIRLSVVNGISIKIFLDHQQALLFFKRQIPMLVTVKILRTTFCGINAGKIIEVEASGRKLILAYPAGAIRIQRHENTPVPAKDVVHVSHVTDVVAVEPVVVGDPAGV